MLTYPNTIIHNKKIYATEWTCQVPGSTERKGWLHSYHPVQNKSRQGKQKIYHKTQDMNSTSDPESAVIISTKQQGRTLGLTADMELICTLLL